MIFYARAPWGGGRPWSLGSLVLGDDEECIVQRATVRLSYRVRADSVQSFQPLAKLVAVVLDPVLHEFASVSYRAQVTVNAFYERRTAVA